MEIDFLQLLQNFGFPAAMCFWFMFRTETVIKANTKAFEQIKEIIQKCQKP